MKEQLYHQVEEAIAKAIATLAIELIETGVVIATRKLQQLRTDGQQHEEGEGDDAPPQHHLIAILAAHDRPLHINELIMISRTTPGQVNADLLQLEMAGQVQRFPGGLYAQAA